LELARLELAIDARNIPACHAAEHAGYELEAVMRSYMLVKGRRQDVALYSLIAPAG
jgi:RimJ/RimL family protein N-acetyltransferase